MDVLSNTWGKGYTGSDDHTIWKPAQEVEHLFTKKMHPNIAGHNKIADWLENELRKLEII